ncbi:unnamed protein product [Echinostoma caproni]|uniref:Uncharacterized protein n=1 Tax=Echinostoma caproni TaxID=27848 RepID=A0A3P8L498_9TREM|nr:unnamed protein product [Echinostoma caproni]
MSNNCYCLFIFNDSGEAEILQLFQAKESRGSGKPLRIPVAGCRCTKGHLLAGQPNNKSTLYETSEAIATHYRVIRPKRQTNRSTGTESPTEHHLKDTAEPGESTDIRSDGTVLVSRATCRSLRHERTVVDSIRKGVECGLTLVTNEPGVSGSTKRSKSNAASATGDGEETFVSIWQPGDIIQCYVLVPEPRKIEWQFETKNVAVDEATA